MQIKLINDTFFPIAMGSRKELILKLMMRTFIFLFCATLFGLTPKHVCSQNEKIVIDADKLLSVDAVFKIIKSQTGYSFVYHENLFKDLPVVQLKKGKIRLHTLLSQSLSAGDITVIFTANNAILIKDKASNATAQQIIITGKVTDQAGLGVPAATVLIKGTTKGVVTDIDGHYTISVSDPAHVLVFSSLGFETKEITVGNQTSINITLKEEIGQLDEVVLKGYYKSSRKFDTGSVSSIKAETIDKQPVTNPLAAMTGYMPGVNITQETGIPGGGFKIEIRGKNFIDGGSEPLYIVDGVPYNSTLAFEDPNARGIYSGGRTGGLLSLINPSSIESIEVLKDGDATAIYGSRGANGVVLITTKKGKAGKTKVALNVTTGLASVPRFVELLNTEQYLEMRKEAITNDGFTPETFPNRAAVVDLLDWDPNRYTNWQEVLIGGTAYTNTANLSVSGGNQQTQFLLSGAYQNETTVLIANSKYGKASVHGSINHQSTDNRLKLNFTIDYTTSDSQLPASLWEMTREAYSLAPNAPALYDANGDLNWENSTWVNPLAKLEYKYRAKAKNVILNTILSYRPTRTLELKANLGYTNNRNDSYNTIPTTANDPALGNTSAQSVLQTSNGLTQSWIVEPQINWEKAWDHASLNMLLGATFSKKVSKESGRQGKGFPSDDDILNLEEAYQIFIFPDNELEYNYQSFFGRFNFKWTDRYIINLTGRRDGSSRFGPGKQFGNFGALGIAWLFSKESFLEETSWFSFGKLRSSYGITGSDASIGDYAFFDSYEYPLNIREYNGPGLNPKRLFNPNYAWESNNKFEVALELGFLQDRIFLTTAWYRNRSSNQLIGIPLPGTTGFSLINSNFDATVENTGLEIDFRSTNIQNDHFKWTTTFNISIPRNKLVKFDGLESSTFRNDYVVGEPLSIERRYHNIGIDQETGIYQFEDYNNDGVIDIADKQWIEHTAPKFYGGFGNTIRYKNWTLDAFFQFKKQRGNIRLIQVIPGISKHNQQVDVLDRWQQVGDQALVQRYTSLGGSAAIDAFTRYNLSDKFYTDASFIKLRNVSLSYDLATGVIPGMDVSIYLQGHNVLTFTKYKNSDPEMALGGRLPPLRKFTLGLKLGF